MEQLPVLTYKYPVKDLKNMHVLLALAMEEKEDTTSELLLFTDKQIKDLIATILNKFKETEGVVPEQVVIAHFAGNLTLNDEATKTQKQIKILPCLVRFKDIFTSCHQDIIEGQNIRYWFTRPHVFGPNQIESFVKQCHNKCKRYIVINNDQTGRWYLKEKFNPLDDKQLTELQEEYLAMKKYVEMQTQLVDQIIKDINPQLVKIIKKLKEETKQQEKQINNIDDNLKRLMIRYWTKRNEKEKQWGVVPLSYPKRNQFHF